MPLDSGALVLAGRVGEVEDARADYGERRIKAFGVVDGLMYACPYTMQGAAFRVISVHRVRERETRRWLRAR